MYPQIVKQTDAAGIKKAVDTIFTGRKPELQILEKHLRQVLNGHGRMVLINGPSGVGKTCLIEKFLSQNIPGNVTCKQINFEGYKQNHPYQLFIHLLQTVSEDSDPVKNFLASIKENPRSKRTLDLQGLHDLHGQNAIIQQQIAAALLEYARDKALVIHANNLHQAGKTIWQFLHYLTERISDYPVLILASLRQEGRIYEEQHVPAYSDILQRMNRDGLINRITLENLTKDEMRQLLNGLFPKSDFGHKLFPLLYELSHGNPFHLSKIINVLKEKDIVYQHQGIWFDRTLPELDQLAVWLDQENSSSHLAQFYTGLNKEEKELFHYCALNPDTFSYQLIAKLSAMDRKIMLKKMHHWVDAKILQHRGGDEYSFRTPDVRNWFLKKIPVSMRPEMHNRLVEVIEKSDYMDPQTSVELAAYHAKRGSDTRKAFNLIINAAELAMHNFAFSEARDFLNEALRISAEFYYEMEKFYIISLHVRAAWLDRVLGFYPDSLQHCSNAMQLYDATAKDSVMGGILIQKSFTYFRLSDYQKSRQCLERCLEFIDKQSDFEKTMVYYGLGNIHFETATYQEARQWYQSALQLARKYKYQSLIALILNNLGALENVTGNPMNAVARYSEAIPLYEKAGDQFGLARIYNNMGMTWADQQNWSEANRFYGKSLAISDVMGLVPLKTVTFLNRALALIQMDDIESAREYAFKAFRLARRLKDHPGVAEYYKITGIIFAREEQWKRAEQAFNRAGKLFGILKNRLGQAETDYELSMMEIARQNYDKAMAYLDRARKSFQDMGLNAKAKGIERQRAGLKNEVQQEITA